MIEPIAILANSQSARLDSALQWELPTGWKAKPVSKQTGACGPAGPSS
jgi:hypothetical protein